ncbi:hypothetical protein KSP39_PZI008825 [Platanthera zijinensis]|uniref:Uncharacterized protein n=1 Tax=Platanthera zijinensis TaxID=2320716 RepID=A0AAP0BK10_9ASPA
MKLLEGALSLMRILDGSALAEAVDVTRVRAARSRCPDEMVAAGSAGGRRRQRVLPAARGRVLLVYSESYAQRFDLLRHVRFPEKVVGVEYVGATEEEMKAWDLWSGTGGAFGG